MIKIVFFGEISARNMNEVVERLRKLQVRREVTDRLEKIKSRRSEKYKDDRDIDVVTERLQKLQVNEVAERLQKLKVRREVTDRLEKIKERRHKD